MSIFAKKEKIVLFSEAQKDELIEKLENAHIEYDIREKTDSVFSSHPSYIVSVRAGEMKKVV